MKEQPKEIHVNLDLDIRYLAARVDNIEAKITISNPSTKFDPQVSIIIAGLQFEEGEIEIKRGGPGVIKLELRSVQERVTVLRQRQRLRNNERFSRFYLRSAKSHTERLIDLNFRTLLPEIPTGINFYIPGSG